MHGKRKPKNEWDKKKTGHRHGRDHEYSDDDSGEWKRLERRQKGKNKDRGQSEEREEDY